MSDSEPADIDRLGVATLTRQAFAGRDMGEVWNELMAQVNGTMAPPGVGMDLAVVAQLLGQKDIGLRLQSEVLQHHRLFRSPCSAAVPGLKVLALAAETDVGANMPIEFLLSGSDVELTTLFVVPGLPAPSPLPNHDVAFVIAPMDSKGEDTLAEIDRYASAWPRPMLNPSSHLRDLERDRLYRLLSAAPGVIIPITARISRTELSQLTAATLCDVLPDAAFPIIVRPTGSHAGFGLAKLDRDADVAAYLAERPEETFFASRYVDYAGADGQFRKYRLACVDGVFFAVHMAISDQWRIWYLNADMTTDANKRAEEAHFMATFDAFAARHADALGAINAKVGLDYFQVDCAEAAAGELLVFEIDNAAIVHDMDPPDIFPYKAPQMRRIFAAFVDMLYARAGRTRAAA